MGCDIHSIAQVKINDQWETKVVDIANGVRDYNSFAIMATVRGTSKWNMSPRGLPKDLTVDYNREMFYNFSWNICFTVLNLLMV